MAVTYSALELRQLAHRRLVRHRERAVEQYRHTHMMSWWSYRQWRQWSEMRTDQLVKEKDELWQISIDTDRSVNDT